MSPPAASYMRPGAGLYVYVYIYIQSRYVYTGTLQRLRWPLTALFPSDPCTNKKFYIYTDGTHTHAPQQRGG